MKKILLTIITATISSIFAFAQEDVGKKTESQPMQKSIYFELINSSYRPHFLEFNNIYKYNLAQNRNEMPNHLRMDIQKSIGNARLVNQVYFGGGNILNGQAASYQLGKNVSYTAFSYTTFGFSRCATCGRFDLTPGMNYGSGVQFTFGKPGGATFSIGVSAERATRY